MTCSSTRRTDQPPRRALSRLASVRRWTAETSAARDAVMSAVTASRSDCSVLVMPLIVRRYALEWYRQRPCFQLGGKDTCFTFVDRWDCRPSAVVGLHYL